MSCPGEKSFVILDNAISHGTHGGAQSQLAHAVAVEAMSALPTLGTDALSTVQCVPCTWYDYD